MSEMELNPIQQQYIEKIIDIPASYAGQQVRIAFIMQGDDQERWLIDNVEATSICNAPSNLSAYDLTLTTAKLKWTNPPGVTSWEVEIVPLTASPTGTGNIYTGALPYQKTGLTVNTDYKYYVRSLCADGGKSAWIGPYNFSTLALGEKCGDPIILPTTFPYVTTNNTSDFGDNYEGITGIGCNATGNYLFGNDVVYSYTPTSSGSININVSNTNGNNAGVFVYSSCSTIGISCVAGATVTATVPGTIPTFAVTAGTTYYIVISSPSPVQATPYTLTIQQVTCPSPTALTATGQTAGSANLSWAAGTATAWQIAVQNQGSGLPSGSTVQNVTFNNITSTATSAGVPFTAATAYEYYVRANCGDGTYSIWSGPFPFSTTQVPVPIEYSQNFDGPAAHGWSLSNVNQTNKWYVGSATSNSGTNSLYISNDNGVNNQYTVTSGTVVHAFRDIQIPAASGNINISFDSKGGGQSNFDYINVWLVPSSFVPTPGTPINAVSSGGVLVTALLQLTPNWSTQNTVINAAAFSGTTRRLVFEWRNDTTLGSQPGAAIDNVNVKAVTCVAPSALTLGSFTQTTATYTWTAPAGAPPAGYDYYYSQSNVWPNAVTTPSGTTTTPTATISGLAASETYYMWIRSSCGTTNKSFWVGPVAVIMPQTPSPLPYSQNFDSGAHGFAITNGLQANKWFVGTAVSSSPTKSLYITNDNGITNGYAGGQSTVQAFKDIAIPADAFEIDINFDFKCVGEINDYLRIWMVPANYIPAAGTLITAAADRIKVGGDMNLTSNGNWTTINLDTPVGAFQGTARRLVFEWRNDASNYIPSPAAIDNISVSVVTCPKPLNLAAINVTNTNATLDWTEAGSATGWEIAYMPALGATMPTTPGIAVSGNSEYTPASGTLVYGTAYVYYVRANCGGTSGFSKWAGPYTFALKPVNDECASATTVLTNPGLTCSNFVTGSLVGATASAEATTCLGIRDDDVWYQFVATNISHIIKFNNVTGNNTFYYIAVYSGSNCAAMTQVACGTTYSTVVNNLVVGQTYKIRLWTSSNVQSITSSYQLCITTPPLPPANDECIGAYTVPVNSTLNCSATAAGTIYSATASPQPSTCNGNEDDDVWFKFVATHPTHRISFINAVGNGTTQDTYLAHALYSGDCTSLVQMYCSDKIYSWANGLVVGQTYYIRFFSYIATTGLTTTFDVCVGTPPPPPANDECAGAVTVPINPAMLCEDFASGTILSATASPEANTCGNTSDDDDVWFEFTAASTIHAIEFKNITGSTADLYHAVYVGDVCGTLTQLYCNDTNYSFAQGLTIGLTYKIRVWSNTDILNQTSAFQVCITTPPPPPVNDECTTSIVVPVNPNAGCTQNAAGSIYGATASLQGNTCGGDDADDVWFKFTAINSTHIISLTDIVGSTTNLYHVLYAGDQCDNLTLLACNDANNSIITGLIPGDTYTIRVYTNTSAVNQTSQFNVCIRVPNIPIEINTDQYSMDELVTDVLINSECALVSNIITRSGPNFGEDPGIAYFDSQGGTFPFDYGVVLATGNVNWGVGPYVPNTNTAANSPVWVGDADLSQLIQQINPDQPNTVTNNASVIEFDFIPLTNKFSFDFLFASNEYGTYQCSYSDVFAFFLTDENGNTQNLAVIPNTNMPVSALTIRDMEYNALCESRNAEYFGQYNAEIPAISAINYIGQTKALTAKADVVPGQSYHIKLAVADHNDRAYNAAVFLEGGSFDIGEVDLGDNMLVSDGNAVCETQSTVLDTELVGDQYIFTWYKDGILIPGATESVYEVTESGTYGVEATIQNLSCKFEGLTTVEYYQPLNELTGDPATLTQCDASGFHAFDITPNLDVIVSLPTDPANFLTTVHTSEADAQTGDNPIDPASYTAYTNTIEDLQTLWTRTIYSVTGCIGIKSFDLIVQDLTPVYTIDSDFSICEGTSDTIDVVITDTDPNPVTYTWTKDGAPLPDTTPSITVTETGAYTVVLDRTGCTVTSTVNVFVTPIPVADAPADITVCESYVLPVLSTNNTYYNAATSAVVPAGTEITETTTFNIVASSGTTPECTSQSTFTVTVNNALIIPAIADVAACDTYVLPALTVGNYYTATGAAGNQLHEGDEITATQTIYVYAETDTLPNCISEINFVVTINASPVADAPADVDACDNYALPALSAGNTYWTEPNGAGEQLPVGYTVDHSMEIFVLAQTVSTPICTDQKSFNVNITPTPAFNLGGPYEACVASNITITVADSNFNDADATYQWKLDGVAFTGGNSIVASEFGTYEVTVTINNCSHSESIEVTKDTNTIPLIITDGCVDGMYMLGVTDDNGSFDMASATYAWTGPNDFVSSLREFKVTAEGEYFVTVTTIDGCFGEDSFIVIGTSCTIQRGISPNGDGANDYFDLSELNVKYLSIFNRYGEEVYSKNNYKNEWNGQTNNGQELPTGTYFYTLELMTGENKTGWIYINRQD
jgi:gliding motility-associated-like protein